ncbi:MAG: leucine-rich repeat domain-containing protein [bacterium]
MKKLLLLICVFAFLSLHCNAESAWFTNDSVYSEFLEPIELSSIDFAELRTVGISNYEDLSILDSLKKSEQLSSLTLHTVDSSMLYGVGRMADMFPNLIELNIHNCSIDLEKFDLNQFHFLKTLYFENNDVANSQIEYSNENLERIELENNDFDAFPSFATLSKNITFLELSGSKLEEIDSSIFRLKKLETLVLNDNEIENIPAEIDKLLNLCSLIFSNNDIQSLPDELQRCKNLEWLDLADNNLKEIISFIDTKLYAISLSGNPDLNIEETLNKLPRSLGQFYYSRNGVNNVPEIFKEFYALSFIALESDNLAEFPPLPDKFEAPVVSILLAYNNIEHIPKRILKMPNLRLQIEYNKIKEINLDILKLESISLEGNPLTEEFKEKALKYKSNNREKTNIIIEKLKEEQ